MQPVHGHHGFGRLSAVAGDTRDGDACFSDGGQDWEGVFPEDACLGSFGLVPGQDGLGFFSPGRRHFFHGFEDGRSGLGGQADLAPNDIEVEVGLR